MVESEPISVMAITPWLKRKPELCSVVLFGSSARGVAGPARVGPHSDLDLHVVVSDPQAFERTDWQRVLPDRELCLRVIRPATGGARKITVVFANGQIDLVVVSARSMREASLALRLGSAHRNAALQVALDEMATCLNSGYRFIKGEKKWGAFYARVAELPGVRLGDHELAALADGFLCDLLWVFEKLARGEVVAAQHALHTKLGDVNLRCWRELHRRRGGPLRSFGLGRNVERSGSVAEQDWIRISARADATEIYRAAWRCLAGLRAMMREMCAFWAVPAGFERLLAPYASASGPTPAR